MEEHVCFRADPYSRSSQLKFLAQFDSPDKGTISTMLCLASISFKTGTKSLCKV